ncbi:MAG: hypothetical protein ACO1TE_23110 [Prosthecobacter sp.]
MKTMPSAQCSVLSLMVMLIAGAAYSQEAEKKAGPPVEFPKLAHFEPLWKRSIFTTKDLPSPDLPTGPNFADNLSLSGVYEIDGAVVAVLVDRVTSQVMEARIGSENEVGIKIRKVTPGETVDKTRIQLQRGDQAGWVGFVDGAEQPAEVVQKAVIPTQQGAAPAAPAPNGAPPPRRVIGPAPTAVIPPVNPILPPPPPAARPPSAVNDVPLPPP